MLKPTCLIAALLFAGPVLAQSAEDEAAIKAVSDHLMAVTLSGDMTPTVDMMAPGIIAAGAEMTSLDPEKFKDMMRLQVAQMKDVAEFREAEMSVDAMTWHETGDGTPYALIPTHSVIAMKSESGGRQVFEQNSQTLALQDGGAWYLVRVSDPAQQQMLTDAYPSFAGVSFPAATTEVIEE
ncbi:hypothetical protein PE067_05590 [Paracoccus sp. DMF-8]|uniref:hypothetical protein n=1 Tax=Paracoccus sp. DMF-8 TaxID=3019445 RepID=UPI0023E7DB66|nr:hypothetical protein [Paracoccus sp. DMF-8]MDF3605665.1 hypothetical protein [Paracoccus sp. DMF-8]